jgi:hypothetical protein
MLQTILKLIVITLGVGILSFFVVFGVRSMGERQIFKAPPHPWFDRSEWRIWQPPLEKICSARAIESDDQITAVPVVHAADASDRWDVPCEKPVEISEFLKRQKQADWLLQVKGNDTTDLDTLVSKVAPFDRDKHFAVQAESQKVAMYLRKKAPEWLYAADSTSMVRLQLFTNLWIETAMEFWPDFVILTPPDVRHWKLRTSEELQRRGKRVIWNNGGEKFPPDGIPVQGVVTY